MTRCLLLTVLLCTLVPMCGAEEAREGLFVAVGHGGRRMTSRDGLVWENDQRWNDSASDDDNVLFDVAFGAGKFVAAGGGAQLGRIVTTQNGREWKELPPLKGCIGTITFGNGRFIAAHGGELLHSTDGETFAPGARLEWEGRIHPRRSACGDTEAGFRTVVVGDWDSTADDRRLAWRGVTSDGTRWDHAEADAPPARDVAYGSGHFVVIGPNGLIESSHDGEAWQRHEIAEPEDFSRIVWTGTRFLISGGKAAWSSPDGLTWKPEPFAIPCSLAWARDGWPALGFARSGHLSTSIDFAAWKMLPIPAGPSLQAVTFGRP